MPPLPPSDPAVPWMSFAPLTRAALPEGSEAALAEGVRLVPMPDWLRTSLDGLDIDERTRAKFRRTSHALVAPYEAESLGTPDRAWGPGEDGRPRSLQQHAEHRLVQSALALWLVRPTRETIDHIVHARCDAGEWWVQQFRTVHVIFAHPGDEAPLILGDFHAAAQLHRALLAMRERGTLDVALGALMQGLRATTTTMRFLMCWIAAEAIFGAAQEVTYRLAMRVATLLRPNGPARRELHRLVRDGYRWRCKVVHGTGLAKFTHEEWLRESTVVEGWLREALRKILLDPAASDAIDGRGREDYLDDLQFAIEQTG